MSIMEERSRLQNELFLFIAQMAKSLNTKLASKWDRDVKVIQ